LSLPYNESELKRKDLQLLLFSLFLADLGLWDMILNLRPVPLAVIGILVLFSLFSWTIVFSKSSIFSRARKDNRKFLRAFRKAQSLQSVAVASEQFGAAPLVAVLTLVMEKSSAKSSSAERSSTKPLSSEAFSLASVKKSPSSRAT
jgi:biopolymer transport protein ExbB/TolQ